MVGVHESGVGPPACLTATLTATGNTLGTPPWTLWMGAARPATWVHCPRVRRLGALPPEAGLGGYRTSHSRQSPPTVGAAIQTTSAMPPSPTSMSQASPSRASANR